MTAWGKTGRVSVTRDDCVKVGFRKVGVVFKSHDRPGMWAAGPLLGGGPAHLPTRDEAIMWVLRRARPDVWREERPVVWKVWTHPRPADPFGPAGWQWLGGPDKDTPRLWDGPKSHMRGCRRWIINYTHHHARDEFERQRAS